MDDQSIVRRVVCVAALIAACSIEGKLHLLSSEASEDDRKTIRKAVNKQFDLLAPIVTGAANCSRPTEHDFAFKWWDRLVEAGGVHDLPRCGRPRKISDEELDYAAGAILRHSNQESMARVTDQEACQRLPEVAFVLYTTGAAPSTFWNAMRARTNIRKNVVVEYKRPQTIPDNRSERLAACEAWCRRFVYTRHWCKAVEVVRLSPTEDPFYIPPRPLPLNCEPLRPEAYCICFTDCKRIIICPETHRVWGAGGRILVEDPRLLPKKAQVITFYSVVCGAFGGVYIKLVTGTQGEGYTHPGPPGDPNGPWLVSHASSQPVSPK